MNAQVKRLADPLTAQKIWDAIEERGSCAADIIGFCHQQHSMSKSHFQQQLLFMVHDSLLDQQLCDNQPTSYTIPTKLMDSSAKDWYCFACHQPGSIVECSHCYRVYHIGCLTDEEEPDGGQLLCRCCQVQDTPVPFKARRKKLNAMLFACCDQLLDKFPYNIQVWKPEIVEPIGAHMLTDRGAALKTKKLLKETRGSGGGGSSSSGASDAASIRRFRLLVHRMGALDLVEIRRRADILFYRNVHQFRLHVATVVHNVAVFHGAHSLVADAARLMQRHMNEQLEYMAVCPDCYVHMHADDPDWFVRRCQPPHQLVYAKERGHPWWPAKIVQDFGPKVEVLFFGFKHERAILDSANVRPLTDVSLATLLPKKPPASWRKSVDELERHRKLLDADSSSSEDDLGDSTNDGWDSDESSGSVAKPVAQLSAMVQPQVLLERCSPPVKRIKSEALDTDFIGTLGETMVTAEVKEEVETALSVTLAAVDHQDASEVDQLTNQLITKEKLLHEMTQAMMAGDKKQRELQETVDRLNAQLETEKKQLVLLKKKFLALKKKQWVNSLLL